MLNLKGTLESFSLSEDTRRKILIEDHPFGNQGNPFIPSEFKEIAQIALAGHFLVSTGNPPVPDRNTRRPSGIRSVPPDNGGSRTSPLVRSMP